jgi:hypothetical protein
MGMGQPMTTFRRFRDAGDGFPGFFAGGARFLGGLWIFGNADANGYRLCGIKDFEPLRRASAGLSLCYKRSQMW